MNLEQTGSAEKKGLLEFICPVVLEGVKPNAADRVGAICICYFQFLLVTYNCKMLMENKI